MPVVRLTELLAQPDASEFLRGVVASGRAGTAYLFHGPAGIGKGKAALSFARALLCERVPGAGASQAGLFDAPATNAGPPLDDACGACAGYLKSGLLQHPDLKFLFPVSGEEKELDQTI